MFEFDSTNTEENFRHFNERALEECVMFWMDIGLYNDEIVIDSLEIFLRYHLYYKEQDKCD